MSKDNVSYVGEYFGEKMTHLNLMDWMNDMSKKEGVRPVAVMPPMDNIGIRDFDDICQVKKDVSDMLRRGKLLKATAK